MGGNLGMAWKAGLNYPALLVETDGVVALCSRLVSADAYRVLLATGLVVLRLFTSQLRPDLIYVMF
jgi:hypothetical protein